MIVACLWIVQPFILALHGPVRWLSPPGRYCYVCKDHVWPPLSRRSGDDAVISDGVYHPYCFAGLTSIVDGSGPLIKAISSGDMTLPDLAWLNTIPVIGAKLYAGWHNLLDMGGTAIMAKVRPYIGTTHHLVRWAGGAYRALYGALCADASLQCPAVLAR
ncbi:putative inner membrane protein [Escherichia coli]|uniref:Putative inner membrane protein n=1 Tax=Escherichia coli TaxID=562 RepID=A0A377BAG9_ECOLX|nr:putative inner membrane protein [Escherichia coli]